MKYVHGVDYGAAGLEVDPVHLVERVRYIGWWVARAKLFDALPERVPRFRVDERRQAGALFSVESGPCGAHAGSLGNVPHRGHRGHARFGAVEVEVRV